MSDDRDATLDDVRALHALNVQTAERDVKRGDVILLALSRDHAELLYELLGETPHDDRHSWAWTPRVRLADALGYDVPAWVRAKVEA